ncbi:hypothetical protein Tco_0423542 [Tanacetum coccineum]
MLSFPDHLGRWVFENNPRNHRENNSIHFPQASRAFGLDTISATESDEFIKSSVEILVPIPSESKGVPKECDVPFHDNSPPLDISKDQSEDFSDSNVDSTSTDEDSFSSNDVEY